MANKILIPVPTIGFDPTEVAIAWQLLSNNGVEVIFTSPNADKPEPDMRMLTGKDLGILKGLLMARKDAVAAYHKMQNDDSYAKPIKYSEAKEADYDGIYLPGGHDKPVKEYLESELLQEIVVDFFNADKPVAAICHGVVLAARSIDKNTQKSVLYNRKTTALLKSQEMAAYNLTRLWLKDYYLTYPGMTVEDEVTDVLSDKSNFIQGPNPIFRDDLEHMSRGFCLRDGNYLSARWPGDVYNLTMELVKVLGE